MNIRLEEYDDEDDYIRCEKKYLDLSFLYFVDMGELEKEDIPPEESDEEVLSHHLRSKGKYQKTYQQLIKIIDNSSVETFAMYSSDSVCSYESTTSTHFPEYW